MSQSSENSFTRIESDCTLSDGSISFTNNISYIIQVVQFIAALFQDGKFVPNRWLFDSVLQFRVLSNRRSRAGVFVNTLAKVSICKTNIVHFAQTTFTAPFNNMRTLKFKAQPTNAFFATVNQMTTSERGVIKSGCLENPNSEQRIVANSAQRIVPNGEQRILRIVRIVSNSTNSGGQSRVVANSGKQWQIVTNRSKQGTQYLAVNLAAT